MRKMKIIRKYLNYAVLFLIMVIFISGFYLLSVYTFGDTKPKTIVLDKELYKRDASDHEPAELKIDKVAKVSTNEGIWNIEILNNDSLIYKTVDNKSRNYKSKVCVLDMNNNLTSQVDKIDCSSFSILPKGKKILYSISSANEGEKTYLFDLQKKEIEKTFGGRVNLVLPDESRYVGSQGFQMFIQDLNTGERKNIASMVGFEQRLKAERPLNKLSVVPLLKKITDFKLWNFKSSVDGNRVYFTGYSGLKPVIYSIDVENGNEVELLTGDWILDFKPLHDGNLLLCGKVNGEEGLFNYDTKRKEFKRVLQGTINSFDITSDGKLAYVVQNNKGISELHTAHLFLNKIDSDKMVYSDLKYVSFLRWNKDEKDLFCVSNRSIGCDVFMFSFKQ